MLKQIWHFLDKHTSARQTTASWSIPNTQNQDQTWLVDLQLAVSKQHVNTESILNKSGSFHHCKIHLQVILCGLSFNMRNVFLLATKFYHIVVPYKTWKNTQSIKTSSFMHSINCAVFVVFLQFRTLETHCWPSQDSNEYHST
jgi:hypothetical protein